jgi:hypothetical protein
VTVEAAVEQELEPDEVVTASARGSVSRYFVIPWTWPGEFFARPVVVVLTSRRLLVFGLERFENRITGVVWTAPPAGVEAKLGWAVAMFGHPEVFRLDLRSGGAQITVNIDAGWEEGAREITHLLDGQDAT